MITSLEEVGELPFKSPPPLCQQNLTRDGLVRKLRGIQKRAGTIDDYYERFNEVCLNELNSKIRFDIIKNMVGANYSPAINNQDFWRIASDLNVAHNLLSFKVSSQDLNPLSKSCVFISNDKRLRATSWKC